MKMKRSISIDSEILTKVIKKSVNDERSISKTIELILKDYFKRGKK